MTKQPLKRVSIYALGQALLITQQRKVLLSWIQTGSTLLPQFCTISDAGLQLAEDRAKEREMAGISRICLEEFLAIRFIQAQLVQSFNIRQTAVTEPTDPAQSTEIWGETSR